MPPVPGIRIGVRRVLCLCVLAACRESLPSKDALQGELKAEEQLVGYRHDTLPGLHREIVRGRVLNTRTMEVTEILRGPGVRQTDNYPQLVAAEHKAARAMFGAGGEGFDTRVDQLGSGNSLFTVQFVLGINYDSAAREIVRLGAVIQRRFENMALIHAGAEPARQISHLEAVESMVAERPREIQSLVMAQELDEAPLVAKHAAGWGSDIVAAIWEPDACVNREHPDFRRIHWQPRYTEPCDEMGGMIPFHSTMVADAFAAYRSDGTAGLYQGQLFDVNDDIIAAADQMWARNPLIVNASFTTSGFDAKVIDTHVFLQRSLHVFAGAGNVLTNGEVATCPSYNALCVGGFFDQDTPTAFQDDVAAGGASWRNSSGREMPEVLGPYRGRKLAISSFANAPPNYADKSGTSFSTPAVAGLAALLIANYPVELTAQPEAVRAVLMASAQAHPIPDQNRVIPDFADAIDDRMGVGAPSGIRAKKIMDEHTARYGGFLPALTGQPGLGLVTFPVAADDRVRVVLTWDQCPDYWAGTPVLSTDLDLVVVEPPQLPGDPAGGIAVSNISFADNWEIVEFRTRRGGTAAIHVSAPVFRPCPMAPNPQVVNFGLAWTTMPDPLVLQP